MLVPGGDSIAWIDSKRMPKRIIAQQLLAKEAAQSRTNAQETHQTSST
jgi:hypothetical protein